MRLFFHTPVAAAQAVQPRTNNRIFTVGVPRTRAALTPPLPRSLHPCIHHAHDTQASSPPVKTQRRNPSCPWPCPWPSRSTYSFRPGQHRSSFGACRDAAPPSTTSSRWCPPSMGSSADGQRHDCLVPGQARLCPTRGWLPCGRAPVPRNFFRSSVGGYAMNGGRTTHDRPVLFSSFFLAAALSRKKRTPRRSSGSGGRSKGSVALHEVVTLCRTVCLSN